MLLEHKTHVIGVVPPPEIGPFERGHELVLQPGTDRLTAGVSYVFLGQLYRAGKAAAAGPGAGARQSGRKEVEARRRPGLALVRGDRQGHAARVPQLLRLQR